MPSMYARTFDESNKYWSKRPMDNKIFLQTQNNWFNDMLQARGHIFLNEVYDALGMKRSREGVIIGWLKDGKGDGYVGLEIKEIENGALLIDFNVDGVIYNNI